MDAYDDLLAAVRELGYPEELGYALAAGLGGEWAMKRMAGYLRGARPRTMEEIADDPELSQTEFTQEELLEAVSKLPAKQRAVFNLYAVEHYPHAKIAEALGISAANSKVLLSRARAELQQRLKVVARRKIQM